MPPLELLINAFIVVYLFFAWCWDFPDNAPEKKLVNWLVKPVAWLGLYHGWKMFSPDPMSDNRHLQMEFTFEDGTSTLADYPECHKMSVWKAFSFVKARKWEERIFEDQHNQVRPGYAEYLCRQPEYADRKVKKIAFWLVLQPIAEPFKPAAESLPVQRIKFFEYVLPRVNTNA